MRLWGLRKRFRDKFWDKKLYYFCKVLGPVGRKRYKISSCHTKISCMKTWRWSKSVTRQGAWRLGRNCTLSVSITNHTFGSELGSLPFMHAYTVYILTLLQKAYPKNAEVGNLHLIAERQFGNPRSGNVQKIGTCWDCQWMPGTPHWDPYAGSPKTCFETEFNISNTKSSSIIMSV